MSETDTNEQGKKSWRKRIVKTTHWCLLPLRLVEHACDWLSNILGRWSFLKVMRQLASLAIFIAVIFWFAEYNDRQKAKHYQAWQVIYSANGEQAYGVEVSKGKFDALEDLANDKVSLAGIDISDVYLCGINLKNANLSHANLSGANLQNANLSGASLYGAKIRDTDFSGANLSGVNFMWGYFAGVNLRQANLYRAKFILKGWEDIENIQYANIYGVNGAAKGFVEWAKEHGAVEFENHREWKKYINEQKRQGDIGLHPFDIMTGIFKKPF
ncbi:MAG: pentapeptide repeat-containing protein [Planctomycetota bacterium]|jgi:hypothetical protein